MATGSMRTGRTAKRVRLERGRGGGRREAHLGCPSVLMRKSESEGRFFQA